MLAASFTAASPFGKAEGVFCRAELGHVIDRKYHRSWPRNPVSTRNVGFLGPVSRLYEEHRYLQFEQLSRLSFHQSNTNQSMQC